MINRGYAKVEDVRKNLEGYSIDLATSGTQQVALSVKFGKSNTE
jgi:hypothetical protein